MEPHDVERSIRRGQITHSEVRSAIELAAEQRARAGRALASAFFVVISSIIGGAFWVVGGCPLYAHGHAEATGSELRQQVTRSVSIETRKQAAQLLEMRARDAIQAIREAAPNLGPGESATILARIRAEIDR